MDYGDVTISEEGDYRPLSTLAVVGFVLGLASPLAWLASLLTILPVAAFLVSLVALSQLSHGREPSTGRPLALLGVALAVTSFAAAQSRQLTTHWLLDSQASQVALDWLELIRTRQLDQANAMAPPAPVDPQAPDLDAPAPPKQADELDSTHLLVKRWPAVRQMLQLDGWSGQRLDRTLKRQSLRRGRWSLSQVYLLVSDSAGEPMRVAVRLDRFSMRSNEVFWRPSSVELWTPE